ncbi:EamA family transporter [Micromonospora sp. WMMD1102]|uniref:EamA family transporter n=1 Tax=Micromonospora sp. WMMD1102 TaxID=3016105 RepID=UPI00241504CA|nr:EamA family transporter [Micromonospora sp. WMMD1102]MDG4785257.1 EamA family transporter [Micromonospora sp. WMMD1102]
MTKRGWLLFGAMSVIWGIPYLLIKVAVDGGVPVPVLVFVRTALGALVLLPLAVRGFRGLHRHWRPLVVFATLEILVPWWLLADAERQLSSSMTGLLIAASPIVAVLAARLAGDVERLGASRLAGLAVGLAGVAVLAAPGLRGGNLRSVVEVLVAAVCYAVAPLILARRLADVPALPLTVVCLGGSALVYATPAALTWPAALPTGEVLAALAGLAVVCTALAFVFFAALIREVGATRAVVITYVNPAVAVTAGVLLLDEPLTVPVLAAFTLILAGSVLATRRAAIPSTSAPSTSAPSTSAPSTSAPSTSAPSTSAPSTSAPSTGTLSPGSAEPPSTDPVEPVRRGAEADPGHRAGSPLDGANAGPVRSPGVVVE